MEPLVLHGSRIDESLRAPNGQRIQALFDAYRFLSAHDREDFVIAMIGRLLIERARRVHEAHSDLMSPHPQRRRHPPPSAQERQRSDPLGAIATSRR
ncbi:MAG: hypothetical protein JWQ07_5146 [Ramlibacter sp.]|nr:hypothetical protein [Ramlibacter sp.]